MKRENNSKSLIIAGLQVTCKLGRQTENFQNAEHFVTRAVKKGAKILVLPELFSTGYLHSKKIWKYCEKKFGPTELWLIEMARTNSIYIGGGFIEYENGHYYNTYSLANPKGEIVARVKKRFLPLFENFLFKPGFESPSLVKTEYGKIGIGICHEIYRTEFFNCLQLLNPDLILLPHCNPVIINNTHLTGLVEKTMLSIATFTAKQMDAVTILVNQYDKETFKTPIPIFPFIKIPLKFTGHSIICNAQGEIKSHLTSIEGIVIYKIFLKMKIQNKSSIEHSPLRGFWTIKPGNISDFYALIHMLGEKVGKIFYWGNRKIKSKVRKTGFPN